jgi:deazaflavin-dependent oxidoreductase (nitroreductase family)
MQPDPTLSERKARDEAVLAELRANRGRTDSGHILIVLTTTGTRTATRRDKPVCAGEDGDDLVVAGSAGGQSRHPQWYLNLAANPELTVEYRWEAV